MSYIKWINTLDNECECDLGQGLDTMLMIFFEEFKEFIQQIKDYETNNSKLHFNNTFKEDGKISFELTFNNKKQLEDFLKKASELTQNENIDVEVQRMGNTFSFSYTPDPNRFLVSLYNK